MGNVEDVRKVIQDLVSPDLKTLTARMEAHEKEMKMRFDQAEQVELERFAAAEKMATRRHETALAVAAANHAFLLNAIDMDKRLARLESECKPEPQHA